MTNLFTPSDDYAGDVLRGVKEIAAYLGESERRTHYLLENKMVPGYQIGRLWRLRRSTHLAHIRKLETAD